MSLKYYAEYTVKSERGTGYAWVGWVTNVVVSNTMNPRFSWVVPSKATAEILHQAFPSAERLEIPELRPDAGAEAVAHWLGFVSTQARVALVGHEPDLGALVAWLTTGSPRPYMHLKKASAVLLECEGRPGPGSAVLSWALPPRHLRLLGGAA